MITLEKTPLIFRIILPVLWYGFIFYLTELPYASGNHTRNTITEIIRQAEIKNLQTLSAADTINFFFRSSAHFFMFGFLAILIYFLIKPDLLFNKRLYLFISIVVIGILGALDEFHQSYVPERRPRLEDVIIDSAGSVVLLYLFLRIKSKLSSTY